MAEIDLFEEIPQRFVSNFPAEGTTGFSPEEIARVVLKIILHSLRIFTLNEIIIVPSDREWFLAPQSLFVLFIKL